MPSRLLDRQRSLLEYLTSGAEPKDFWSFCREDLRLSEHDAWAQLRHFVKTSTLIY